jgi:hypothetical protein
MSRAVVLLVVATLLLPRTAASQDAATPEVWRDFARRVEVGSELRVRLRNGQRFSATIVGAAEDALLLQPKTRRPVEVQRVAYSEVESLERRKQGGMSAAKAVGIGVGVGAGVFLGFLLMAVAALD